MFPLPTRLLHQWPSASFPPSNHEALASNHRTDAEDYPHTPPPSHSHHTHPAPLLVTARDRKPPIGSSQPGWSTGRPPTARSSIFSFDFLQCFKASAGTQRSPSLPTHPTPAHSDDGKSTITNSRGKRINRRTDRWTSRHHHHPPTPWPRGREIRRARLMGRHYQRPMGDSSGRGVGAMGRWTAVRQVRRIGA